MTEIEQKALALLNERHSPYQYEAGDHPVRILASAIEQHEAYKQEVSDALLVYQKADGVEERSHIWDALTRFILSKPVDPLVEALNAVNPDVSHGEGDAELFRAALAKSGLEVREIEN